MLVERRGIAFRGHIHRGVESFGWHTPDIDEQFPAPLNGFFFEVITERPIAKHFEEGVVIGVVADILQVVVFAACTDALLCVGRTCRRIRGFLGAEEVGHELIHPRIGKEQAGRLWHQRSRWHWRVLLRGKEVEKGLADFGGGHDKRKSCEAELFGTTNGHELTRI